VKFRKEQAERVGIGFNLEVVPKLSKKKKVSNLL
jgi:hypothetical protein